MASGVGRGPLQGPARYKPVANTYVWTVTYTNRLGGIVLNKLDVSDIGGGLYALRRKDKERAVT